MLPIITPKISPNLYPAKIIFQPNPKRKLVVSWFCSKIEGEGGDELEIQHFFDNRFPHNPQGKPESTILKESKFIQ